MTTQTNAPRAPEDADELVIRFEQWARRVPLGREPLVLGRGAECDVQLVDPKISRRHCRLAPAGDGTWLVEDLGSRTGTFLGGLPLQAPTPVRPGDRLQIGPMEAQIEPRPTLSSALASSERDARNIELLLQTFDDL